MSLAATLHRTISFSSPAPARPAVRVFSSQSYVRMQGEMQIRETCSEVAPEEEEEDEGREVQNQRPRLATRITRYFASNPAGNAERGLGTVVEQVQVQTMNDENHLGSDVPVPEIADAFPEAAGLERASPLEAVRTNAQHHHHLASFVGSSAVNHSGQQSPNA